MPRVRKPNAEIQHQDKQIIGGFAHAAMMIAARHGNAELKLAAKLMLEFVELPAATPKPRVRKPKAAPHVVEMAHADV